MISAAAGNAIDATKIGTLNNAGIIDGMDGNGIKAIMISSLTNSGTISGNLSTQILEPPGPGIEASTAHPIQLNLIPKLGLQLSFNLQSNDCHQVLNCLSMCFVERNFNLCIRQNL